MQIQDKNGPPGMRVEIICQTPKCGQVTVIDGFEADRLVGRLWGPAWKGRRPGLLHMRELLGRLTCAKCKMRRGKVSFELAYVDPPCSNDKRPWLPDYDFDDRAGNPLDLRPKRAAFVCDR